MFRRVKDSGKRRGSVAITKERFIADFKEKKAAGKIWQ